MKPQTIDDPAFCRVFPLSELPTPVAAIKPARRGLTSLDFALYGTVVLLWGFSWGAMRYQVGVVAPEISGLWRFAIAAPAMLLIGALRGERLGYGLEDHGRFVMFGATMFCVNFVVVYYAAKFVTTGLIATSFSLAALVNVAMGALILRAPIDPRVVIGGLFGVTGVALMFYPEIFGAQLGTGALIGFALSLICTVSFSLGNVVSVSLQRRGIPVFVASGYGMLYGCAMLAVESALLGHPFIIEWTASYILSLIYLGAVRLGDRVRVLLHAAQSHRRRPRRLRHRADAGRGAHRLDLHRRLRVDRSRRDRDRGGDRRQCAGAQTTKHQLIAIRRRAPLPTGCRATR